MEAGSARAGQRRGGGRGQGGQGGRGRGRGAGGTDCLGFRGLILDPIWGLRLTNLEPSLLRTSGFAKVRNPVLNASAFGLWTTSDS